MTFKGRARTQELLHYLYNKAKGVFDTGNIPECNLYGDKEPWEIWEECKGITQLTDSDKDVYVFTKVKKKTARGTRLDRTVGTGAWKGEDTGVAISANEKNDDGTPMRLLGKKKRFRYESETMHDHRWLMIEYSLDASIIIRATFQDYVLCQLKRMGKSEKQQKLEEQEELGIKIIDNESLEAKRQKKLLMTKEEEQLELTCNNNNGIGAMTTTTKNTKEVAIVNSKLPCGDGQETIVLSKKDIGATKVERQLIPKESSLGELICKELTAVSNGGNLLSNLNDVVSDNSNDAFAKELMKGQAQPMEEPEIEMLPNLFYHRLNGCELLPK